MENNQDTSAGQAEELRESNSMSWLIGDCLNMWRAVVDGRTLRAHILPALQLTETEPLLEISAVTSTAVPNSPPNTYFLNLNAAVRNLGVTRQMLALPDICRSREEALGVLTDASWRLSKALNASTAITIVPSKLRDELATRSEHAGVNEANE